jgi:mycoredoxin
VSASSFASPDVSAAGRPVMYTTTWCGYCARLKAQLRRADVDYDEIDIESHPDGAAVVADVNRGNLTVPTVVFSDGSAMTNPSARQVADKVAALS